MAYTTIDDVKRILNIDDNSITDAEIEDFIDEAHRFLLADIGRDNAIYRTYLDYDKFGNLDKTIELPFKPIESVEEVRVNGDITTDYTIDTSNGKVTLTGDVSAGDHIKIKYTPSIYKDYETYRAAIDIILRTLINTDSNVVNNLLQNYKEKWNEIRKTIKRENVVIMGYVEHKENLQDIW
ncbi:MAG: hypothetical protein DRG78_20720 [Epsilonproteobacteria bacterium]|nr:MAG: hypothetical protein DRG78_20720 [Campylobacterota bacterium]